MYDFPKKKFMHPHSLFYTDLKGINCTEAKAKAVEIIKDNEENFGKHRGYMQIVN